MIRAAIALGVLSFGLLASSVAHGQSQTVEQPKFRIEMQTAADGKPWFTVTNLSSKTLTACQIRFTSSQGAPGTGMAWDPLVQGGGDSRREPPRPLEPHASVTLYLPHAVGGPLPDKVEIVAGIWADGETFGEADWVKQLLNNRASFVSAYEQAIAFLQQGLQQNWTRTQYLAALNSRPSSLLFYAIQRTLQANGSADADRRVQLAMQGLLEYFMQNLDPIRKAKLPGSSQTNP